MALDVVSLVEYNGKYTEDFYKTCLLGSEVLNQVFTILPNVKNKQQLSQIDVDPTIQDADCSFTSTDITLTEKEVSVVDKKVNVEYCYKTLEQIYYSQFLQAGSNNTTAPAFDEAVIMRIAERTNDQLVKNALGAGAESVVTEMAADGTVLKETLGVVDSTNAIDAFSQVYQAYPDECFDNPDLFFLVSTNVYRALKVNAIDTQVPEALNDDIYGATFLGIPVFHSGALADNTIIMSHKSNMIYATDLLGDKDEIEVIDRMPVSGEPNVRFVAHFKYDFTYVFGAEIVLGTEL